MEKIESLEDEWKGVVTYRLSDGRMAQFDKHAVREHGVAALMRELGEHVSSERIPVMRCGRKVGTLPGDFDPDNIKSLSFLYDPRPGDFRREGDTWIAAKNLGGGDLEAVPGFERFLSDE